MEPWNTQIDDCADPYSECQDCGRPWAECACDIYRALEDEEDGDELLCHICGGYEVHGIGCPYGCQCGDCDDGECWCECHDDTRLATQEVGTDVGL